MTKVTEEIEGAAGPLSQMGLTGYEAKVLVTLLKLGRSTVREIYPVSGVPRSAVYGVLERLRAKGLVQAASTRPTSYISVSAEEVMEIMESDFERKKGGALEVLKNIHTVASTTTDDEEVWLLNDAASVIRTSKRLIDSSNRKIIAGVYPARLAELKGTLLQRAKEGVEISVLAGSASDIPGDLLPAINLVEFRDPKKFSGMPELSLLICDDSFILFSLKNPLEQGMENGFWSKSKALISFFSLSLRISIKTDMEK